MFSLKFNKKKTTILFLNFLKGLKTREFPFPLFINTGWVENPNIVFLKKLMGVSFEPRPEPWVTIVTVEAIHSGDFLVVSKIHGLWGGFEMLEEWLTGAHAGYTVDCLRESEGMLWVGESEHENDKVKLPDLLNFCDDMELIVRRFLSIFRRQQVLQIFCLFSCHQKL